MKGKREPTPRDRKFVAERLKGKTKRAAALAAGFSDSTARDVKRKIESKSTVQDLLATEFERSGLKVERVLHELCRIAFLDPRGFFDESGNLVPPTAWTADQAAAVAGFEVIIKNAQAGDGETDTVHKVKLAGKDRALEILAKHFGLLIEKVDHSGEVQFRWMAPSETS